MRISKIEVPRSVNKELALYQLERELTNRGEAIMDAIQKAIQYETLIDSNNAAEG